MDEQKKWYKSKTLWANLLAGVTAMVAASTGFQIDAEVGVGVLAILNLILRVVTKTGLEA